MLHHQKKADSREFLPVGKYQSIFKLEKERCNEEGVGYKDKYFLDKQTGHRDRKGEGHNENNVDAIVV